MAGWLVASAVLLPLLGALAVWVPGTRWPRTRDGVAVGFAVAAGVATLALLPFASPDVAVRIPLGGPFGDLTFVPDGLGAFMAAVCTSIGAIVTIYSVGDLHGDPGLTRYFSLVLLFIGAMCGMTLAGGLLLLVLCWELVGLCSFALIAYHADQPAALAGGVRALVVTQLGGVGLLIGAFTARAYLGTYDVAALLHSAGTIPAPALTIIAFGFLIAAAAKSAQVPFHTWLPGAMEAPTPISALIHAATMVNAGVYLLARFQPAFGAVPGWSSTVVAIGLTSALVGALLALTATDLKRALAASTTSQIGLLVLAVGVGAVYAGQLHLLSHAIFKALLFLSAGAVIHAIGTRDLRRMGGLGAQLPFTRAAFVIGALGLAGLPIANGFWSKDLLVTAGIEHGGVWLGIGLLTVTGLTALYAFRLVSMVFFGPRSRLPVRLDAPQTMRLALGSLAVATLLGWLFAGPLAALLAIGSPATAATGPSTLVLVLDVLTAPTTALSLGAVAIGLALWWWRASLGWLTASLRRPTDLLIPGLACDWLNQRVVALTSAASTAVLQSQTGRLSWNLTGLVGALVVLLAVLAWEA